MLDWSPILPLCCAVLSIPSGFALGYLGSERRTREGLLLASFGVTFAAGVSAIWFAMNADPPVDGAIWLVAALGSLVGGFGLGALGGLASRAFGMLGWIVGVVAALIGFWYAAAVAFAFIYGAAWGG